MEDVVARVVRELSKEGEGIPAEKLVELARRYAEELVSSGELSEDELDRVAGGVSGYSNVQSIALQAVARFTGRPTVDLVGHLAGIWPSGR